MLSSSTPDVDPYATLHVAKDASLAQIKASYRKLVLKCHPDKVKDESLHPRARDEFQRVQEAYELLTDDARRAAYDRKLRTPTDPKKDSDRPCPSTPFFTSRASPDKSYYDDDDDDDDEPPRFYTHPGSDRIYEEMRPKGWQYDDYDFEPQPAPKEPEERRKKTSTGSTKHRSAADAPKPTREHSRKTSSRAKNRDKERRREYSDKYAEDYASESDYEPRYTRQHTRRHYSEYAEPKPKPPKPAARYESPPPPPSPVRDWESASKHDYWQDNAREYINRARGGSTAAPEPRPRMPPRSTTSKFEPCCGTGSCRHTPRTHHTSPPPPPSPPREAPEPTPAYKTSKARFFPGLKIRTAVPPKIRIPPPKRSTTMYETRPSGHSRRDSSPVRRSDGFPPSFTRNRTEPIIPKASSKLYDSGYSSSTSPATPEAFHHNNSHHGHHHHSASTSSASTKARFIIIEDAHDYRRGDPTLATPLPQRRASTASTSNPKPFIMQPRHPPPAAATAAASSARRARSRDFHFPTMRTSSTAAGYFKDDHPSVYKEMRPHARPSPRMSPSEYANIPEMVPRGYKPTSAY
ncbi:hypothetical protein LOZ53_005872 [Ophidiomyces ophidiicola]|nr:hypothetical protein LOZ53_005872 [Ophidiomyces ophidiicola]